MSSSDSPPEITEAGEGLDFSAVPPGTIVEVRTQNTAYTFAVSDPQDLAAAFRSTSDVPDYAGPWFCKVLGSGRYESGFVRRQGWVLVGESLYLDHPRIGEFHTSPVRSVSVRTGLAEADRLFAEARVGQERLAAPQAPTERIGQ